MQLEKIQSVTDDWELRANKVLSHFKFNQPNEIDMQTICWRYGIRIKTLDSPIIRHPIGYEYNCHLKALSFPKEKGRRGTIYLKPGISAIEEKIVLAEEFCHLYSHYHSQLDVTENELAKAENQAKRMAAYLLMPERFLKSVIEDAIDDPVLISDIANYFDVTEEFAHYRIQLFYRRNGDALLDL